MEDWDIATCATCKKELVKFRCVMFEIWQWTDKQTDRQTDILSTILRTPPRSEENMLLYFVIASKWSLIITLCHQELINNQVELKVASCYYYDAHVPCGANFCSCTAIHIRFVGVPWHFLVEYFPCKCWRKQTNIYLCLNNHDVCMFTWFKLTAFSSDIFLWVSLICSLDSCASDLRPALEWYSQHKHSLITCRKKQA